MAKKNSNVKKIRRQVIQAQMSPYTGDAAAKMIYGAISKMAKRTPKKQKKSNKSSSARGKRLELSRSASMYLKSYISPFATSVSQVCVPRPPSQRSYKVTGFIRGTGYIGQSGIGFVAFAPCLANNYPAVYFTTAAYNQPLSAGPPSDQFVATSATGGANFPANVNMSNLPFNLANLTAGIPPGTGSTLAIAGRIVSSSIRIQYTGTTLNQSGMYYAYADPDLQNVLGGDHLAAAPGTGYSVSTLSTRDATEINKVTQNNESSIIVIPTDPNLDDYPRPNNSNLRKLYPYANAESFTTLDGTSLIGCPSSIIMITGQKDQPFYFEAVTHAEYLGPGIPQALLSESETDVVGYDTVKNLLTHAQREVSSNPRMTLKSAMKAEMGRQKVAMGKGQRSVDY